MGHLIWRRRNRGGLHLVLNGDVALRISAVTAVLRRLTSGSYSGFC